MNKEVEIKISPEDAKGLVFGSEIKATVMGKVKSIKEEKECMIMPEGKEEKEPEIYVCIEIEPTSIKLGGKEIDGGDSIKEKFGKGYDNYLGIKKSMEKKGKMARANGERITGE